MTRALKRFAFLPMALDAQYPAILQSAISTPCDDVCSCFMAKQYYMYDFRVEDWALPSLGNTVWYRLAFCLRPHCVLIIGAIMKSNIITQLYVYHVLYCIVFHIIVVHCRLKYTCACAVDRVSVIVVVRVGKATATTPHA